MRNKYLIHNGYYIKDNLKSFLLYFDYFSQGLSLPRNINYQYIRKITHIFLRFMIILTYYSTLYKLLYKRVELKDSAEIIINGPGKWGSYIRVINQGKKIKISKTVKSTTIFNREKKFYQKYSNNQTTIKLPHCIFHKDNTIEMEFIQKKSFQRLILEGKFSFIDTLENAAIIKNELKKLYKKQNLLIHGDLWPGNILIDKDTYYVIDFSDAHTNYYAYDIYTLIYSILSTFHLIKIDEKTIINFVYQNFSLNNFMGVAQEKIIEIENSLKKYRQARFPGTYYN